MGGDKAAAAVAAQGYRNYRTIQPDKYVDAMVECKAVRSATFGECKPGFFLLDRRIQGE